MLKNFKDDLPFESGHLCFTYINLKILNELCNKEKETLTETVNERENVYIMVD